VVTYIEKYNFIAKKVIIQFIFFSLTVSFNKEYLDNNLKIHILHILQILEKLIITIQNKNLFLLKNIITLIEGLYIQ